MIVLPEAMSYIVYKIIHLAGIMTLFAAIGGLAALDPRKPAAMRGFVALHGIALLLVLTGGFGMQAKLQMGIPGWMIAKLAVWLLMGFSLVIFKRQLVAPRLALGFTIGLGVAATYLGIYKPF